MKGFHQWRHGYGGIMTMFWGNLQEHQHVIHMPCSGGQFLSQWHLKTYLDGMEIVATLYIKFQGLEIYWVLPASPSSCEQEPSSLHVRMGLQPLQQAQDQCNTFNWSQRHSPHKHCPSPLGLGEVQLGELDIKLIKNMQSGRDSASLSSLESAIKELWRFKLRVGEGELLIIQEVPRGPLLIWTWMGGVSIFVLGFQTWLAHWQRSSGLRQCGGVIQSGSALLSCWKGGVRVGHWKRGVHIQSFRPID